MQAELEKFVLAELYTDLQDEISDENQRVQYQRFGTTTLPLYAILTADGKTVAETGGAQVARDEFLKFVKDGYAAAVQAETSKAVERKVHATLPPAEEEARRTRKPIFVNFMGVQDKTPMHNKLKVLSLPEVQGELERFVVAELHTDLQDETSDQNRKIQMDRFGTTTLPLYVILTADGKKVAETGGAQIYRDEFLKFLRDGHSAAKAGGTPAPTPAPSTSKAHGNTIDDLAAAEAESKKTGKPLLVEFTGEN